MGIVVYIVVSEKLYSHDTEYYLSLISFFCTFIAAIAKLASSMASFSRGSDDERMVLLPPPKPKNEDIELFSGTADGFPPREDCGCGGVNCDTGTETVGNISAFD
jgi:hypothetical protein